MKNNEIEYYSDLEKLFPAASEAIEPAFQHMVGVMGMRYMKAVEVGDKSLMVDAAISFWGIIELINLQTIFLSTPTHASIAIGNMMRDVSRMIKADLGIDLICGDTEKKFTVITMNDDCNLNWNKQVFGT
jgi:hypothetical protein